IEGKNFDIRKNLWKYAYFLEVQRKIVHQLRQATLEGKFESIFREREPGDYEQKVRRHGMHAVRLAEGAVIRAVIDRRWADFLRETDLVRQSIHMLALGGMNPLREYQKSLHESFGDLQDRIDREVVQIMQNITITEDGADLGAQGLVAPTSTWTYLVNDNACCYRFAAMLGSAGKIGFAAGAALMWMLLALLYLAKR